MARPKRLKDSDFEPETKQRKTRVAKADKPARRKAEEPVKKTKKVAETRPKKVRKVDVPARRKAVDDAPKAPRRERRARTEKAGRKTKAQQTRKVSVTRKVVKRAIRAKPPKVSKATRRVKMKVRKRA